MARILIADDNPALRGVVRDYIKKVGKRGPYEFVEVQTGEEAIERIRDNGIDVAIMSQQIGRLTGEDVIDNLTSEFNETPCAIMTGDEDTYKRLEERDIEVFKKPNGLREIPVYVDSVLS